jgi:hypothetical protein
MAAATSVSTKAEQLAQAPRQPTLPERPPAEQRDPQTILRNARKGYAEQILAREEDLAAAKKALDALTFAGGENQTRANAAITALAPAVVAALNIVQITPERDRLPKELLREFLGGADLIREKWSQYQPGAAWSWNPLKVLSSVSRVRQLAEIRQRLDSITTAFKELKPYLLEWAERPVPEEPGSKPRNPTVPVLA